MVFFKQIFSLDRFKLLLAGISRVLKQEDDKKFDKRVVVYTMKCEMITTVKCDHFWIIVIIRNVK